MRLVRNLARDPFEALSYAANAVLVLLAALLSLRLLAASTSYWTQAGPIPSPSRDAMTRFVTDPTAIDRILSFGLAWACGVFAFGMALLAIAGVRHLVIAGRRILANGRSG